MKSIITISKIEKAVPGYYYLVKFYNHESKKIMYHNGLGFEHFPGEEGVNDEIESWELLEIRNQ